jgi:hypothetical protein
LISCRAKGCVLRQCTRREWNGGFGKIGNCKLTSHSTEVPTILTKGRATWVCHSWGACKTIATSGEQALSVRSVACRAVGVAWRSTP